MAATINGYCQKFRISGEFETGYYNLKSYLIGKDGEINAEYGPFYSGINIKTLSFNEIHADFKIENIFEKSNVEWYSFRPLIVNYETNLYVDLWKDKINIGISHGCLHPVVDNRDDLFKTLYRVSFNRIYVKIKIGQL